MSIRNTSKESIRSRLLKNAAHYWGQDSTQSLDPFVRLLMEALSVELYKAYNEIQTTDARLLEKITRLLTPELYVSARPAHAVAHLRIQEPGQSLSARNQFYQQLRVATREEGLLDAEYPVVFTPLNTVRLYDGDVQYLVAGNTLFTYNEQKGKVFKQLAQEGLPAHKVWVGLALNPAEDLSDLSCYLHFTIPVEDWAYTLLPSARWAVNGAPLRVRAGQVLGRDAPSDLQQAQAVFEDYEIMRRLEEDIQIQYQRSFITLENLEELRATTDLFATPDVLRTAFPNQVLDGAGRTSILWLEVTFPTQFTAALLDHLYVAINAFPVVNRKLQQLHHHLTPLSQIVPVVPAAHEQLLAVTAVADDRGRNYYSRPFQTATESGTYSVRYGGAERFDERSAREHLHYLAELLRDEVASFAAYGKDFVRNLVTDLSQKVQLLTQKTGQDYNRFREQTAYLVVAPIDDQPVNLAIEYWVTNSALANGLRVGTELLRLQTALPITTNPVLLTDVGGAQEPLRPAERLNAYKYALTTRDRLVTYEDLKSFCLLRLGRRVRDVTIRRGVAAGLQALEGLLSTTDIVLTTAEAEPTETAEWQHICADLKAQIEARAVGGIYYRIWAVSAD